MVHKLALVAIAGITLSAVCLGAGGAIEGKQIGKDFGDGMDFSMFGGRPRCVDVPGATATSRDLEWDGSDHVGLAVHGHAVYTPGGDNRLHVSGDPQMLAHLRVRDGNIEMDCNANWHDRAPVEITLPGREFRKFGIAGSGDLLLQKLDQDELKVSIAGSGSIKADGKVDRAKIAIAGSGDADLGKVAMQVVEVKIAGSGDADAAPKDEADISIAGSGSVTLHSNPRKMDQHIAGSGRIRTVED